MKLIFDRIWVILLVLEGISQKVQGRSTNTKSSCSISTISIPLGTNTPVMVYNARKDSDMWKLTVLEKEHTDNYSVEGHLFYTDKTTGESWYMHNADEGAVESMRDAFSLCRTLNMDNKITKIYDKNTMFRKYRTNVLPQHVMLRNNNNSNKGNKIIIDRLSEVTAEIQNNTFSNSTNIPITFNNSTITPNTTQ
jgi:hypothetical protein